MGVRRVESDTYFHNGVHKDRREENGRQGQLLIDHRELDTKAKYPWCIAACANKYDAMETCR